MVREYDAALMAIREQRHDVYLIDYRLGERTGLELMREAFASRPSAPVIMLTGQADYEIDLEATALGVTDFLIKQELDAVELERSIRYAISHQQAERYALAVRAANDGIWDWDLATDRIYFSPRWQAILGLPERGPRGRSSRRRGSTGSHPRTCRDCAARSRATWPARTPHLECEHRMRHADGSWRWVMARGLATRGVDGNADRAWPARCRTSPTSARRPAAAASTTRCTTRSPACPTARCSSTASSTALQRVEPRAVAPLRGAVPRPRPASSWSTTA